MSVSHILHIARSDPPLPEAFTSGGLCPGVVRTRGHLLPAVNTAHPDLAGGEQAEEQDLRIRGPGHFCHLTAVPRRPGAAVAPRAPRVLA